MQSSFKYNLFEKCELLSLTEELASLPFHCGDSEREKDLEDFFIMKQFYMQRKDWVKPTVLWTMKVRKQKL